MGGDDTQLQAMLEPYLHFEYAEDPPEELTCPICTEPAVEPLKLCEDHLICTGCTAMMGESRVALCAELSYHWTKSATLLFTQPPA